MRRLSQIASNEPILVHEPVVGIINAWNVGMKRVACIGALLVLNSALCADGSTSPAAKHVYLEAIIANETSQDVNETGVSFFGTHACTAGIVGAAAYKALRYEWKVARQAFDDCRAGCRLRVLNPVAGGILLWHRRWAVIGVCGCGTTGIDGGVPSRAIRLLGSRDNEEVSDVPHFAFDCWAVVDVCCGHDTYSLHSPVARFILLPGRACGFCVTGCCDALARYRTIFQMKMRAR